MVAVRFEQAFFLLILWQLADPYQRRNTEYYLANHYVLYLYTVLSGHCHHLKNDKGKTVKLLHNCK